MADPRQIQTRRYSPLHHSGPYQGLQQGAPFSQFHTYPRKARAQGSQPRIPHPLRSRQFRTIENEENERTNAIETRLGKCPNTERFPRCVSRKIKDWNHFI